MIKVNWNIAIDKINRNMGMRAIAIDSKEKVLASMYSTKPYLFDLSVVASKGENLASVFGYWPRLAIETRYLVFLFLKTKTDYPTIQ